MSGFTRPGSLVLALMVLSGCVKGPQSHVAVDAATMGRREASASSPAVPTIAAKHAFAHFPDRGELIAYPSKFIRQDGAYTWHRTELSEAHALHAIADGHLRVTAPSGKLLDFQYDRHIEHPSGDWTWVGHIAGHPDQQTILTFGEHAAFGSIAQPGTLPLRLTVRDGVSWLVETDPRMVAGIVNGATRPQHPDFFVPPKAPATSANPHTAAASPVSMASAPAMASATVSTSTTVDLVLGYTSAFASDNGGSSGAVTHLNYLVDVTNLAYANSQISAKVRLVATVLVNYPDDTSNDSTLEQLTGYDSTSNTKTTPDPAFNGLRAARDQYGADLVSMVRSFRESTNGGCGVGWLIGGGQSGITTSDEYFGYSVVSDGTSVGADGKTYYCLDETLAHELGHNMGAAHDVATAKGSNGILDANEYGAYPYSFGYKSTAGNFYTVMAYGDAGQQIYRTFSNPRTTFCGGAVCGITDQADNARTLIQTIPTVALFRSTVVLAARRVAMDFNGDGRSDVAWHNGSDVAYWLMNGFQTIGTGYVGSPAGVGFNVVAAGDFNGDGLVDLAWSNGNQLRISLNNGIGGYSAGASYFYGPEWQPFAAGDLDGDGKADILWRQGANVAYWLMDGGVVRSSGYAGYAGDGFRVFATGDFDGNGTVDLALASANQLKLWLNTGAGIFQESAVGYFGGGWEPFAATDLNADGKSDLLWHSGSSIAYWDMNGPVVLAAGYLADAGQGFSLVASGDYNGDGAGDLLFSNGSQIKAWLNSGAQSAFTTSQFYGGGWQPFDPSLPAQ